MLTLKIKTKEGFAFKVIAELLQNCLKEGCFIINKTGIHLRGIDSKLQNGTKLVELELLAEYFVKFEVPKEEIQIGINLIHFYKMVKSIKKKDTLTLFIEEEHPSDLCICIQQNGESNKSVSRVKITKIQPIKIQKFTGYNDLPIVAISKEFQKLKTLNKISKYMKVTSRNKKIDFFCDREGVFSRIVSFGLDDDDDVIDNDESDDEDETYDQTFLTDEIVQLVKVAGLSNTIQIFPTKDLPLRFKFNVGLGSICIYIKSKEKITEENEPDELDDDIIDMKKIDI